MRFRLPALGAVALAAVPTIAGAADFSPPARGFAPAPVVSAPPPAWTGFYAGVNAGWSRVDQPGARLDGATFGGRLGFDQQAGAFIVGALADIDYSFARVTTPAGSFSAPLLGSVNARAGYAVAPSTLVYGSGGVSFADFSSRIPAAASHAAGFNVGAGLEQRINGNWSIFSEYRFQRLWAESRGAGDNGHQLKAGVNYRFGPR